MKIITTQFDHEGRDEYRRLLQTFLFSVQTSMPHATVEVITMDAPKEFPGNMRSWANNTAKMRRWKKLARQIDEPTIFMDCDMLLLRDISSAFDHVTDIGVTARTDCEWPINGGVVFVQPTDAAREFMHRWAEVNERMYRDKLLHSVWRAKYGGMNQAALGYLRKKEKHPADVMEFPCSIYNACDEDWPDISYETRVIHYKGALRKATFELLPEEDMSVVLEDLVVLWRVWAASAELEEAAK